MRLSRSHQIHNAVTLMPVTSIKLLDVSIAGLRAKLGADSGMLAATVRAALDAFIASGARPETTRALAVRHNSKVGDDTIVRLRLNPELRQHYQRVADSHGVTLGSLVNSAVAAMLFGLQAPAVAPEKKAPPVSAGWRKVLLALEVGDTREILKSELGASVAKAKANLFAAAAEVRRTIPAFRVITNQQPGALYVARTA